MHIRPSKIQSTTRCSGNKEEKNSNTLKNWSDSERKEEQSGNEKNIVKDLTNKEKSSNEKNIVKGLRKEEKSSNKKNVARKVDLSHPVFSQKLLEDARVRREETPPIDTCLDDLNGRQCMHAMNDDDY